MCCGDGLTCESLEEVVVIVNDGIMHGCWKEIGG